MPKSKLIIFVALFFLFTDMKTLDAQNISSNQKNLPQNAKLSHEEAYDLAAFIRTNYSCENVDMNLSITADVFSELSQSEVVPEVFKQRDHLYKVIKYDNGKIKALISQKSQHSKNSFIHSWYKTGSYLGCAGLLNGIHHGPSIAYHPKGTMRAFANFENGDQIGVEAQYHNDGLPKALRVNEVGIKTQRGFVWTADGISLPAAED